MTEPVSRSFRCNKQAAIILAPLFFGFALSITCQAQGPAVPAPQQGFAVLRMAAIDPATSVSSSVASSSEAGETALPDAPEPQSSQNGSQHGHLRASTPPAAPGTKAIAPLHSKFIPAGYQAQPITAHDKVIIGANDLYSVEDFAAVILSA